MLRGCHHGRVLRRLLLNWILLAVVLAVTAWLVPEVNVEGGIVGVLIAAAVFGIVNTFIGPIVRLLSLPVTVITLGLFSIVINAILLALAAAISDYLEVGGFVQTLIAAVVISVLTWITHLFTRTDKE